MPENTIIWCFQAFLYLKFRKNNERPAHSATAMGLVFPYRHGSRKGKSSCLKISFVPSGRQTAGPSCLPARQEVLLPLCPPVCRRRVHGRRQFHLPLAQGRASAAGVLLPPAFQRGCGDLAEHFTTETVCYCTASLKTGTTSYQGFDSPSAWTVFSGGSGKPPEMSVHANG